MPLDLMTIVLTESIKLLLKDGWQVLKNFSPGAEIIQLNIGDLKISEKEDAAVRIAQERPAIGSSFARETMIELEGLNRRLENLLIDNSKFLANIGTATTAPDRAMTEAAVARTERDIEDTRRKIWNVLQQSGKVSVTSQPKSSGASSS